MGYNSYLSSWSLMNTGNAGSDYGYWFPGKENDGATGWAFMSAKSGQTWLKKNEQRGVWHYDGEIDLGYAAAFSTARTLVVKDEVFGLHAYGGELTTKGSVFNVIPKDGVRQQFSYVVDKFRYHLTLKQDGFLKDTPIVIASKGKKLKFFIENRQNNLNHTTLIKIQSEKNIPQKVMIGDEEIPLEKSQTGWQVNIPMKHKITKK